MRAIAQPPDIMDDGKSDSPIYSLREQPTAEMSLSETPTQYRTYKRRWFGLFQLVLMNIVVSWTVRTRTICALFMPLFHIY